MKLYEKFSGNELVIAEKIQQRRYQLLIHSCIYYHLNKNLVTDDIWSKWAVELRDLQNQHPEISKQVDLYEYFSDWDGSTGAFLPITLPWVIDRAKMLLKDIYEPVQLKPVQQEKKSAKRRLF